MRNYDDMTQAMNYVLRLWSKGDAACWVGFEYPVNRLDVLSEKWAESYGTRLSPERRRWRRVKGLPIAKAVSMPVLGEQGAWAMLLGGEGANIFPEGPWGREKWLTRPPEIADLYVMVKEPRNRGDYAWTWKLQDRQIGLMSAHLTELVKSGDASAVRHYTNRVIGLHPMFGGVRRNIRRLFTSAKKLWTATWKTPWPGPDPDKLPAMVGFR